MVVSTTSSVHCMVVLIEDSVISNIFFFFENVMHRSSKRHRMKFPLFTAGGVGFFFIVCIRSSIDVIGLSFSTVFTV